jgi:hypothetical protein
MWRLSMAQWRMGHTRRYLKPGPHKKPYVEFRHRGKKKLPYLTGWHVLAGKRKKENLLPRWDLAWLHEVDRWMLAPTSWLLCLLGMWEDQPICLASSFALRPVHPCQSHLIKHALLWIKYTFLTFSCHLPRCKLSKLIYKKENYCYRLGPFDIPLFLSFHLPVEKMNNGAPFIGFILRFQSCKFEALSAYVKLQELYAKVYNQEHIYY